MNKIEDIRKKCIEANPEIVELKLGCRIQYLGTKRDDLRSKNIVGSFVKESGRRNWVILFNDQSEIPYTTALDPRNCEIIGHPILISDILLAIESISSIDKDLLYKINTLGTFSGLDISGNKDKVLLSEDDEIRWNLKENDLENQSPECINFIHGLLYDK